MQFYPFRASEQTSEGLRGLFWACFSALGRIVNTFASLFASSKCIYSSQSGAIQCLGYLQHLEADETP